VRNGAIRLLLVGGAAVVASLPTALASAAGSAPVTVAVWHMEDTGQTMHDSSGNGHDGTLTGVTTGRAGVSGNGFGFFGSPSRVAVPSSPSLNAGSSTLTVTVHVNLPKAPTTAIGDFDLVRKGLASTSGGDWKVEIMPSGQASCTAVGSSGAATVTAGRQMANNKWHTIVCAMNTGSVRLTVDGHLVASQVKPIGTISNSDYLTLGAKISNGDQYKGVMDEVSLAVG